MAHDVFLSYATEDKAVADAICASLEASRVRCWIAPRDILPGTEYPEAIVEAITSSRITVLVYSAHANRSPHILRELERAVSIECIILPFRLENAPFSK